MPLSHAEAVNFTDSRATLIRYERLRSQRDMFGGGFFSVLLLVTFFFFMPQPESIQNNILFWRLGIFAFFLVVILGWYIRSYLYYQFCLKFLHYEYEKHEISRDLPKGIVNYSPSQVVLYILLALFLPVMIFSVLSEDGGLNFYYWVLAGGAVFTTLMFLLNIEDFHEKREQLEEVEILVESLLYTDPLHILKGEKIKRAEVKEVLVEKKEEGVVVSKAKKKVSKAKKAKK